MRKVVAILVQDGQVIDVQTNEHTEPCKREGYPTGVGYELCAGCNYPNHAEHKVARGRRGGTVYLIGHTYACQPCLETLRWADMELKIIDI